MLKVHHATDVSRIATVTTYWGDIFKQHMQNVCLSTSDAVAPSLESHSSGDLNTWVCDSLKSVIWWLPCDQGQRCFLTQRKHKQEPWNACAIVSMWDSGLSYSVAPGVSSTHLCPLRHLAIPCIYPVLLGCGVCLLFCLLFSFYSTLKVPDFPWHSHAYLVWMGHSPPHTLHLLTCVPKHVLTLLIWSFHFDITCVSLSSHHLPLNLFPVLMAPF